MLFPFPFSWRELLFARLVLFASLAESDIVKERKVSSFLLHVIEEIDGIVFAQRQCGEASSPERIRVRRWDGKSEAMGWKKMT